ncbi:hypothetical protein [Thiosocius teredinicola]|uniref:hypothetical protein n=1 Tax=Thiosocius teredinicola TaxID=1973002 RepID=UPI000990CFA5
MQGQIPLPTDSLYKFSALFGLLIVIASFASIMLISKSTNDLLFESNVEYVTLKSMQARSVPQEAQFSALKRKIEVALDDKKFLRNAISVFAAFGFCLLGWGFYKWYVEVQPVQDELARLSLKKLKRELGEDEGA